MHRTVGDSYGLDGSKRIFRQENTPSWQATQVTYDSMNAIQEEIANVITAEGFSLNASSETVAQMVQLNTAIDKKVTDEATARDVAIEARVPDAEDIITVGGQNFYSDLGALTVTKFHAHLQRIMAPKLAVITVGIRVLANVSDYKWVAWELPAAYRPRTPESQGNGTHPAMAILWDDGETVKQSVIDPPIFAAPVRVSTPSTRDYIIFGNAEIMSENANSFPTVASFVQPPSPGPNDQWYVEASFLYPLFS